MNTLNPLSPTKREAKVATELLIKVIEGLKNPKNPEVTQLIQSIINYINIEILPEGNSQIAIKPNDAPPLTPQDLKDREQTTEFNNLINGLPIEKQRLVISVISCIYPSKDKSDIFQHLQSIVDVLDGDNARKKFVEAFNPDEDEMFTLVRKKAGKKIEAFHADGIIIDMIRLLKMDKYDLANNIIEAPSKIQATLANILYFLSQYKHIPFFGEKEGRFILKSRLTGSESVSSQDQEPPFYRDWESRIAKIIDELSLHLLSTDNPTYYEIVRINGALRMRWVTGPIGPIREAGKLVNEPIDRERILFL
ncbi:MAG: hypothetical protein H7230_03330 [Candidatus Parcubacteria bacterium]|nr:hypothetical protein [Candidatus Paceibacterota bacterium]